MAAVLDDDRAPVDYLAKFREFVVSCSSVPVVYVLSWCPWCGQPLPASLRDAFFDRLEALGLEIEDPRLPARFATDEWWLSEGL